MKRVLFVNKEQADLLLDPINVKIVELLINKELNPTQISEKAKIPISTVWRRLKKLEKAGIVEVTRAEKKRNFRITFYRAKALYNALPLNPDLRPKDPLVVEIYQKVLELREKAMMKVMAYNDVSPTVDPVDYAVVLDVLSNFEVLLENENEVRNLVEKARGFLFSSTKANAK